MKTDGARRLLDGLARRDGFEDFASVEQALETDRPAPDVCENCGHEQDRHVDIVHDKFRVARDCHDCDCKGYRPPITEPAESEGKCRECGGSLDEVDVEDGTFICVKCFTAPPEDALEDAKAFATEWVSAFDENNFTKKSDEDKFEYTRAGLILDIATIAEQYAAKKLAERDKQTIKAFIEKVEAKIEELDDPSGYVPPFSKAMRSVAEKEYGE
jgi:hypothetical protein